MTEPLFLRNHLPWSAAEEDWLLQIYEEIEATPKLVYWANAWRGHPMYHAAKRLGRTPTTVADRRRKILNGRRLRRLRRCGSMEFE